MIKLEDLRPGCHVVGLFRRQIAHVLAVKRVSGGAVLATCELPRGVVQQTTVRRADEARLFEARTRSDVSSLWLPDLQALFARQGDDLDILLAIWRTLQARRAKSGVEELRQQVEARIFSLTTKAARMATPPLASDSEEQLRTRWENAVRILADPRRAAMHGPAETMLRGIGDEWARRAALARKGLFTWPTTTAPRGKNGLSDFDAPDLGMLRYLGYQTGATGIAGDAHRAALLDRILASPLPPLNSAAYMDGWGKPGSVERLQKMAEAIAAFARNAKRNPHGSALAIRHWETDLEHLRRTHYLPRLRGFAWPLAA